MSPITNLIYRRCVRDGFWSVDARDECTLAVQFDDGVWRAVCADRMTLLASGIEMRHVATIVDDDEDANVRAPIVDRDGTPMAPVQHETYGPYSALYEPCIPNPRTDGTIVWIIPDDAIYSAAGMARYYPGVTYGNAPGWDTFDGTPTNTNPTSPLLATI